MDLQRNDSVTFTLKRQFDESGVSGIGIVVWGVEFPDGKVVTRWNTETSSTVVYDNMDDFLRIHVDPHPLNKSILEFSNGWRYLDEERMWLSPDGTKVER